MLIFKKVTDLQNWLQSQTAPIGFAPTMGALHSGHLELIRMAKREGCLAVASIFVNPTQFNDPRDLERYPRNLENDLELLRSSGCNLVFAPEVKEIYPEPDTRLFDFGVLGQTMEGKHRPGHFNGVAQVVSKLFDIIRPDQAYFGLKDFQQLAIIKQMVRDLKMQVKIVACPIVREKSGLAMSSRNELLTAEERLNAAWIYKTLTKAKKLTSEKSVQDLADWIRETINKNGFLNVEYAEIVDEETLQPVESWKNKNKIFACVAVYCGKIRLIDNLELS